MNINDRVLVDPCANSYFSGRTGVVAHRWASGAVSVMLDGSGDVPLFAPSELILLTRANAQPSNELRTQADRITADADAQAAEIEADLATIADKRKDIARLRTLASQYLAVAADLERRG